MRKQTHYLVALIVLFSVLVVNAGCSLDALLTASASAKSGVAQGKVNKNLTSTSGSVK